MDLSALWPELVALGQIIMIDLVLAGDNAIVVGMAAASLPREQRRKAILVGIVAATILRILFASVAQQLLVIFGLTLAGGILLAWVCWKFWREIMDQRRERLVAARVAQQELTADERRELEEPGEALPGAGPAKTLRQAIIQIVIADVSMSLDNVLAVTGAAEGHRIYVLIIGLTLSVGLMAVAATFIANLLKRHHWIAYVGLAVIVWVAGDMIYRGWMEVASKLGDISALFQ